MLKINPSDRPYWSAAVTVILVGITLFCLLIFVKNPKLDSPQTKLEQKTQQVEILVNSILDQKVDEKPTNGPLVNRTFYKFPPAVEKTQNESLVAIEFIAARIKEGKMGRSPSRATGFVADSDGSIITVMHEMGEVPSDWFSPTVKIRVHDGQSFFDVELDKYDWVVDLAMLKVQNWRSNRKKFQRFPAVIASVADKTRLAGFERLYTFSSMEQSGKIFDLPVILGPYLKETNAGDVEGGLDLTTSGVVSSRVDAGFSGGPLIGPDGKVYGVVKQMTSVHSYVVTLEDLLIFIKSDQETIEKKLFSTQSAQNDK